MSWNTIASAPVGVPIATKIDDARGVRNEGILVKGKEGLWWTEDRSVYVYYTPTHWRRL